MARRRDAFGTVAQDVRDVLAERPKPKPKRSKATYDLPRAIVKAVNEIAKAEGVARSDAVAWALAELVAQYRAGEVDWTECREPAVRNPRAAWKLVLPDL